jgi:hypothetical protein
MQYKPISFPTPILFSKSSDCISIIPKSFESLVWKCTHFQLLGNETVFQVPVGDVKIERLISYWTFMISFLALVVLFVKPKKVKKE